MGFQNEKDHPEVAPSQFEMNYSYTEASIAADQILLYKLICRQVANRLDLTASFLPKPVTGVNGSGMHTNLSISKAGKNLFYGTEAEGLSTMAWDFVDRILTSANDICLALNASVNAYRRLDPHFEAPNQIKASPIDRGSIDVYKRQYSCHCRCNCGFYGRFGSFAGCGSRWWWTSRCATTGNEHTCQYEQ